MPDSIREHRVQLGCGTLIVIALIVMFFSRTDTNALENEIRGLRSEVAEIKQLIEVQSNEIRQLREKAVGSVPESDCRKTRRIDRTGSYGRLFVRALALRRWLKHVFAFQGNLKRVGDSRHVVAAARPPEHVEGALGPEVIDQPLACRDAVIDQGSFDCLRAKKKAARSPGGKDDQSPEARRRVRSSRAYLSRPATASSISQWPIQ